MPFQELITNCFLQRRSVVVISVDVNMSNKPNIWTGCYLQPQEQRGAANGIATTAMSLSKAFAPAGAGILYVQN
jgi:hypothetical protein